MKNELLDSLLNRLFELKRKKNNYARFNHPHNLKAIQSIIKGYFNDRSYPSKTDGKQFINLIYETKDEALPPLNLKTTTYELTTIGLDKYTTLNLRSVHEKEIRDYICNLSDG